MVTVQSTAAATRTRHNVTNQLETTKAPRLWMPAGPSSSVSTRVGEGGVEPPLLSEHGPEPCASAISPLAQATRKRLTRASGCSEPAEPAPGRSNRYSHEASPLRSRVIRVVDGSRPERVAAPAEPITAPPKDHIATTSRSEKEVTMGVIQSFERTTAGRRRQHLRPAVRRQGAARRGGRRAAARGVGARAAAGQPRHRAEPLPGAARADRPAGSGSRTKRVSPLRCRT